MRIETNDLGFGEIIYAYTREQALEDGVLIDVSEMGKEAGFKIPVAVTDSVWGMIKNIPPTYQGIQDVLGRLWDVLWMGICAVRRNSDTTWILGTPNNIRKPNLPKSLKAWRL